LAEKIGANFSGTIFGARQIVDPYRLLVGEKLRIFDHSIALQIATSPIDSHFRKLVDATIGLEPADALSCVGAGPTASSSVDTDRATLCQGKDQRKPDGVERMPRSALLLDGISKRQRHFSIERLQECVCESVLLFGNRFVTYRNHGFVRALRRKTRDERKVEYGVDRISEMLTVMLDWTTTMP